MNPLKIIQKYYELDSQSYHLLVEHSKAVTQKAIKIARNIPKFKPDLQFIAEASMLHDIGIFLTDSPEMWCFGNHRYICHGYLWREILEKEGFPKHALVCERHIWVWISISDIEKQNLPIPKREMLPISIEEEIICFADKFFTKNEDFLYQEKSLDKIKASLIKFGDDKISRFNRLLEKLKY